MSTDFENEYGDALAKHAQEWLATVIADKGIPCGNCGTWRPLKDSEITFCSICGDDPYDIYELAANAEDLPEPKREITRESLIADARRIIKNIDQIFIDVRSWNENTRARLYPDDPPIDPDPDGELATARATAQKTLDQFTALRVVPNQEPPKDFEM